MRIEFGKYLLMNLGSELDLSVSTAGPTSIRIQSLHGLLRLDILRDALECSNPGYFCMCYGSIFISSLIPWHIGILHEMDSFSKKSVYSAYVHNIRTV